MTNENSEVQLPQYYIHQRIDQYSGLYSEFTFSLDSVFTKLFKAQGDGGACEVRHWHHYFSSVPVYSQSTYEIELSSIKLT